MRQKQLGLVPKVHKQHYRYYLFILFIHLCKYLFIYYLFIKPNKEHYNKSMTLQEAETLAVSTLKQVMEEKLDSNNVEVAAVPAATKRFRIYVKEEVEAIIKRL
jgi:hypothetical protein